MLATSKVSHVLMPSRVAAELQDALCVAVHDLQRLESLLGHASNQLLQRFEEADRHLGPGAAGTLSPCAGARAALQAAVTELQFQDMASQLLVHTTQMLHSCSVRLAAATLGPQEGQTAALAVQRFSERPNPVTQSEMDAGSIELF